MLKTWDYIRLGFLLPFALLWMMLTVVISFVYPEFMRTFFLSAFETIEKNG